MTRLMLTALFLSTCAAQAMFMPPQFVPAERLLKNLEPHLKATPDDVQLNYTKARIHYLAFVKQSNLVGSFPSSGKNAPRTAPDWMLGGGMEHHLLNQHAQDLVLKAMGVASQAEVNPKQRQEYWKKVNAQTQALKKEGWKPEPPGINTLKAHAVYAYRGFRKTAKLDMGNGLNMLGLASLGEQYIGITSTRPELAVPELEAITPKMILGAYYRAYEASIDADTKREFKPVSGIRSLVSYEAGQAFLRLMQAPPPGLDGAAAKDKIAGVEQGLKKIQGLKQGPITPLIFSLRESDGIEQLVNDQARVRFDLSGFQRGEHWRWLNPHTAFLVWDPAGRGDIHSGQQLFGSYTWQLFWENGFAALRGLDDDRDGWLHGAELDGIRAWFDRDGDGRSSAGEVQDLSALGIEALATDGEKSSGPHFVHPHGLRMLGGKRLPLWDWVTAPLP